MKVAKKKKIIETAKKMFIENGYKRTTVEDITKEMGISKGSFYTYFKTKEEVLYVIIEEAKINIEKELNKLEVDDNFRVTLERYLERKIEKFLLNYSKLNFENIQSILENDKIGMKFREITELEINFIEKNIVNKSNFQGNSRFISDFILLTLDAFLFNEIIENKIGDEKTYFERKKEEFSQIIEFIDKGLNN